LSSSPTATAIVVRPTATPVSLPKVGDAAQAGNWKIALLKVEAANTLGQTQFSRGATAQGKFVVLTLAATNLHRETSTLNTWDFVMKSPDGTSFQTSSDGQTQLIFDTSSAPKAFAFLEQVQPSLTKSFRLVFDVSPTIKSYTFEAAGVKFTLDVP
jgi:Domain of unknown function (DUF4352)